MLAALSANEITAGLATIVVVGVGAQWAACRLDFPSILLLLPLGIAVGEIGLVEPNELFGSTLFPLVTLFVSLLLFQAGLQLRLSELPRLARAPVFRLVTVGAVVTFLGASLAVALIFDVDTSTAFLIGAILVVSGPTVVGPLVAAVRPRSPLGSILNWESTVLDPVGATLGVVVLNLVIAADRGELHPLLQLVERLGVGIGVGLAAAALLVLVLSRFLVTDDMEAAVALLFAVAAFAVAELAFSEAGLFATVTLGIVAANQRVVPTARITGFGETLEVLIIGILFVLLGALVPLQALFDELGGILVLVAVLVVLVRPAGVGLAMFGTKLRHRDRLLIAGMDPRGIVAAATAAQFAGTLDDDGLRSTLVLPVVFGVILGAGIVYGLSARPLARTLGVLAPRAKGICVVGDAPWARSLALCAREQGLPVIRLTTAPPDAALDEARESGIATISVHDSLERVDRAIDDADLAVAVVTAPPDDAITMIEARLIEVLGRRHVVQTTIDHPAGTTPRAVALPHRSDPGSVPVLFLRADGSIHAVRHHGQRIANAATVIAVLPGSES